MNLTLIKNYLLDLQKRICAFVEKEEAGTTFREDIWQHPQGGGGITRVITGNVMEKAGVNFSHVNGASLPKAATDKRPELADAHFEALGVSVVMHPKNPYVPTSHLNVRFILVTKPNEKPIWWVGGGFDLTPYYGFHEDAVHWHTVAKNACDPFGKEVYPKYKKWCDEYFYLKHRHEARGIGGIFFDDLHEWDFEKCFNFMKSVGDAYIQAYSPIVQKRQSLSFTQKERDFQLYRRGRYVEFNLLYDRGTLFGLQSQGRTESILMSLPPLVAWQYDYQPEAGSREAELYTEFLPAREWVK